MLKAICLGAGVEAPKTTFMATMSTYNRNVTPWLGVSAAFNVRLIPNFQFLNEHVYKTIRVFSSHKCNIGIPFEIEFGLLVFYVYLLGVPVYFRLRCFCSNKGCMEELPSQLPISGC